MRRAGSVLIVAAAVCLALAALPGIGAAGEAKVIELTYGSSQPPEHQHSLADKEWIARIEKETGGRVKIKPYFSGQVFGGGPETFGELAQGVVDVGLIFVGVSKSGFALAKAEPLFFAGANTKNARGVFKDVLAKYPQYEKEYADLGLKVLCWSGAVEYGIITRKPVRKLADMKGMRISTSLVAGMVAVLRDLGVEGVTMPASEVYVALQKGILDGVIIGTDALKALNFADVAKYTTTLNLVRTVTGTRAMSITKWNSLPKDVQKVFMDDMEWYGVEADRLFEAPYKEALDHAKQMGVELVPLPKEDQAKFDEAIRKEAAKEAKELDTKGLPATQIYQEAQRYLQANR